MTSMSNERGASLIESLIAMGVLSAGMLAIAAGFLQGVVQLRGSDLDVVAREKAAEAIESVFTARDTRTIEWASIRNVEGEDGDDGGVFRDGAWPLSRPGPDGLVNTGDDDELVEAIVSPGTDGQLGTEDDVEVPLSQFSREVVIRDVNQSLRELRVIIRYTVGTFTREYTVSTLISSYA